MAQGNDFDVKGTLVIEQSFAHSNVQARSTGAHTDIDGLPTGYIPVSIVPSYDVQSQGGVCLPVLFYYGKWAFRTFNCSENAQSFSGTMRILCKKV